jgi:hypothetical protein
LSAQRYFPPTRRGAVEKSRKSTYANAPRASIGGAAIPG